MKKFKMTHRVDIDEFFAYLDETQVSVRKLCTTLGISHCTYDSLKKNNGCMSRKTYEKFVQHLPFLHYYELSNDDWLKKQRPSGQRNQHKYYRKSFKRKDSWTWEGEQSEQRDS